MMNKEKSAELAPTVYVTIYGPPTTEAAKLISPVLEFTTKLGLLLLNVPPAGLAVVGKGFVGASLQNSVEEYDKVWA
jgi:hypothetical protein